MKTVKKKLNRRDFIRIGALAGGGIILGFELFSSCSPQEKKAGKLVDLNAYVKIDRNGQVTLMSPNPEIGQGVKTSLPMLVGEELDIDWKKIKVEQAGLDTDKYTRQLAGGSGSIRTSWEPFRQAGAAARYMLVAAAAKKWGISSDLCDTKDGMVINKDTGDQLDYGELVEEAVNIPLPEEVKVKDPSSFKLIGKRVANVDNQDIVTGRYKYGIDTKREGMLYATIIRPPAFGITLKSYDDTEAKKAPGIEKTVSWDNKIAVLGRSTWEVIQGAFKIQAEWSDTNELDSTEDYKTKFKALLDKPSTEEPKRKDGNIRSAFNSAASTIDSVYEAPFLAHNTMEPMNFFAHVTQDKAELYGPIQTPERTRKRIAEVIGIPESNISILMTRMGGGFGRRLMSDFVEEAAMVSKLAGMVPVNVIWAREHDMTGGFYRPMYRYRYRAAIDQNKQLIAWHNHCVGVNASPASPDSFPAGALPNFQVDVHEYASPISTAPWRAPTHNYLAFAEQSFLDEIAHHIGEDSVAFRLALLEKAKQQPVGKISYDPDRFSAVIKKAAEVSGWGKPKETGVYQGFAAHFSFESYVAEVVEVVKQSDGKVKISRVYCVADCGTVINPSGAETQLQGGAVDGIGHALYAELTLTKGKPDQQNFTTYRMIKMAEAPPVEVHFMQNNEHPTGLGEPGLPPAAPALANAVFAATGTRLRSQPFIKSGLFAS